MCCRPLLGGEGGIMFTYEGVLKWAVVSPRRRIVSGRDAIRSKRCRLLYMVVTLLW